jgi:propionate CoA-transferase
MTTPSHAGVPPVLSAADAAALIPSGSRLAVTGFCSVGLAQAVMDAMIKRHEEGAGNGPSNLTIYHAAGHASGWGCDLMAKAGLISKVVGGHWGLMHEFRRKMMENEIEAHNWPQGMIVRAFREMARGGKWGFISQIGLGTFIDPRDWGGCINEKARATGSLIKLETAPDGSEVLRYSFLPIDFSLIRGWSADAFGNVSIGNEALSLSALDIALAARAQGGKVICQVRRHESERRFLASEITIPGFLIDYLVVADDPSVNHRQCEHFDDDLRLVGAVTADETTASSAVPEGPRGWIGRRAAMEIRAGDIFNLGIGIPGDSVTPALAESGRLQEVVPTLESGVIGGVGVGGNSFGVAISPHSRMDQSAMFDFYHGGGLDITVMGAAEIGANGDINVSMFNGRPTGCGGFIDITQNARRIVFCCTLTAGSLEIISEGGRLRLLQEGKHRKFVEKVQQVTFSAEQALQRGLSVMLVTERCVLQLEEGGWVITEIAPGIDLETEVLSQMDFRPRISPSLREMDSCCFR